MFDKGNSFQNSRVIGEVVFEGDNYVLSFNKDKFVWADDGAEDAFLETLYNNPDVNYIIKTSKKLRFNDDEEKVKNKTKSAFSGKGVVYESPDKTDNNGGKNKETAPKAEIKDNNEPSYEKCFVEVDGNKVPLYVDTQQGISSDDWIILDKHNDGYLVKINFGNKFIGTKFNTTASKVASNAMALVLVKSILKAQNSGLKLSEALILLKSINTTMKSMVD